MSINIIGCGSYLPKKIITSLELEQKLNLEPGWIFQRSGILQRHVLDGEDFLDASIKAATNAIKHADINEQSIQLIVTATTTPYQIMPSTATLIQKGLGIEKAMAFDIQAACTGFIHALILAESFMRANKLSYGLVMGCDAFSKITEQSDSTTGVLFGDGFGAVVLKNKTNCSSRGICYTHWDNDCDGSELLLNPWGIGKGFEALNQIAPSISMNGKEVFKAAVNHFSDEINLALDKNKLQPSDLKKIITHQANIRIINSVCNNLKISTDLCEICLTNHGNTSAASIPLALDNFCKREGLSEGNILLLTGFGAGFTWGTVLVEI
ncbi:3-oxoacyl-[acyl-carrier-protein] synthase 3 [Legionella massiliensis]|uniref:3-oxoacyl-[acyl-carrier-protein] synthase 3 n=1 Tax=Legionella massiliensis TaxID=1034943 RepID=A0A078KXB9_9GAMM|nr:beta-ketoacyl-ACP synthase 3 [Legionella massiliensis]CDZ79050.1 3-oxoacyl-[acyl-carrier-protein] synthase 3 [Legionella massiliensis]CEE14788.1 3-oxoacyl-[acyl-carrier-protein] synthase 3 [Legionella massiliensis]